MNHESLQLNRRDVLKGSAAAGLVLGLSLPTGRVFADTPVPVLAPNAFVRIAPDNTVTVIIKHLEMGQGVVTGLATLVAEELDADWSQIRFAAAPANDELYKNLYLNYQITAGSTSIANSYEQMRKAGAVARAMLVSAAAATWKVPVASVTVQKGVLKSGKHHATLGDMALAAAALPVPADTPLKSPAQFKLIGKPLARLDIPEKSTGKATYTIDIKLPGMLTAVLARAPKFGAKLKSFDATKALAVNGVKHVVATPDGVAVIATGTWQAIKGRNALQVEWDETAAEQRSSSDMVNEYKALLTQPGLVAMTRGDAADAISQAHHVIDAVYEFPYLAHAPMEPLSSVVWLKDGKLDIWSASQAPTLDSFLASMAAGLRRDQVTVHTLMAGGGFGRRGAPDYTLEAVNIVTAAKLDVPLRLQRTREDDMKSGYYRPLIVHGVKAALDDTGHLVGWSQRVVSQAIVGSDPIFAATVKDGIDFTTVDGAANTPYGIANFLVDMHTTKSAVPVRWWRSVGNSHTAYVVETMIDELAAAANKDPLEFRLGLLKDKPRHVAVLKLAAEKAGWGKPLPKGRARGIAMHQTYSSYVAEVIELSLNADGSVQPHRVVVAADCGLVLNPGIVRAQLEGGVGFGLSAALYSETSLDKGVVSQANFNTYKILRMDHMPNIEVHLVDSKEPPVGVGEISLPPIAPAVANALSVLTGKRIRMLPIARTSLKA